MPCSTYGAGRWAISEPGHCLVTGSASGIGLALTRRLLADGWRVCGLDRQSHPADLAASFTAIQVDMLDEAALDQVMAHCTGAAFTAFVHCAGAMRVSRIEDADMAMGDLLWRLHVSAPSIIMRHLAALLPDQRGRVVLLGSRASLGRAGRGLYAASKAAITGLARCWALELVGRGITVNVVAPGATDTPMLTAPDRGAPAIVSLPIGRLIRAEEIAGTIAFLLGPDAGAMTGQTLFVCGGGSLA